jgi:hypothetical protein
MAVLLLRLHREEAAAAAGIRRRWQDRRTLQPVRSAGGGIPRALGAGRHHVLRRRAVPAKYKGGAFIAFHGSWNRAPLPMAGYNITFQAFKDGKPSGDFEVFADGFKGAGEIANPNQAAARPDGVAQAPDGSLYIGDSVKGKIWRVIYKGGK